MKIINLLAENVKKLKAVEITPSGEVVKISGKNGAGKSSVLDSIWWALAGTSNIQKQPIRKGEDKARIKLDLGEIVVERKFTEKGSTLTVESAEGARYPSPQKMLDALLGELSFDPLAFARMGQKEQFDALKKVVKLEINIEELTQKNKSDYDKRTELNREAKSLRAQAEGIEIADDIPDKPIDEGELLDKIQEASKTNQEIEERKSRRAQALSDAERFEAEAKSKTDSAEDLRAQADALDEEADECHKKAEALRDKLEKADPLPDYVDLSSVRKELDEAKKINLSFELKAKKTELIERAEELEVKSKKITETMEKRELEKTEAIQSAELPIDGLSFGDGVVMFEGVPLDQASSAEQLRVSMALAMSANPKLKVIRITDGSLLDEESLEAIRSMAEEKEYQVWMEVVDTSGKVGIVIDDGAVVSDNQKGDKK